jgi:hypothetical protein
MKFTYADKRGDRWVVQVRHNIPIPCPSHVDGGCATKVVCQAVDGRSYEMYTDRPVDEQVLVGWIHDDINRQPAPTPHAS